MDAACYGLVKDERTCSDLLKNFETFRMNAMRIYDMRQWARNKKSEIRVALRDPGTNENVDYRWSPTYDHN